MAIERVILGKPRSFCAGVRRATEILNRAIERYPNTLYCLNEIVHNNIVMDDYRRKNILFVQDLMRVPEGEIVIFSAHGVSPRVRELAIKRHLHVIDATCPFVKKVHDEAKRYAERDYSIILIGFKDHDEVIGILGEAPEHISVINTLEDARVIEVPDKDRVTVLTQTTLSLDDVRKIIEILQGRFPNLAIPRHCDICFASQNRQNVVKELAKNSEIVIVLGSENSSNSKRLVEIAGAQDVPAFLVDTVEKLRSLDFGEYKTLGLTAGASTPESFIREILNALKILGASEIIEETYFEENIHFPLPQEL